MIYVDIKLRMPNFVSDNKQETKHVYDKGENI